MDSDSEISEVAVKRRIGDLFTFASLEKKKGIAPRTRTDCGCCVAFVVFLLMHALITDYAWTNGDITRLTHGYNWQGQLCGTGAQENSSYLFWCRLGQPAVGMPKELLLERPICVPACPTNFTQTVMCPSEPEVTNHESTLGASTNKYTVVQQQVTPSNAYPAKVFADRYCLPDFPWQPAQEAKLKMHALHSPLSTESSFFTKALVAVGGLRRVAPLFCAMALYAFIASYVYLLLVRFAGSCLIWLATFITVLAFTLIGAALLCTAFDLTGHQADSPLFRQLEHDQAFWVSIALGVLSLLLALCVGTAVYKQRETVYDAILVIDAACDCIFGTWGLLVWPTFGVLIKVVCVYYIFFTSELLLTCGTSGTSDMTISGQKVVGVSRVFHLTASQEGYLLFYTFGYYWITNMFNACGWFVISYATALWYFEPKDSHTGKKGSPSFPVMKGLFVGLVYHSGTMALGALLITLTRWFRRIMVLLVGKIEGSEGSKLGSVLAGICCCCISCFDRLLAPFTRAAYIEVALNSTGFVQSARDSWEFIYEQQSSKIAALSGATAVFEVIGSLAIGSSGGYITYQIVTTSERYTSDMSAHYVPDPQFVALVAGVVCYQIATVFLDVLDQSSETLLYAYSQSTANGSWATYATDALKALLGEPHVPTTVKEAETAAAGFPLWVAGCASSRRCS